MTKLLIKVFTAALIAATIALMFYLLMQSGDPGSNFRVLRRLWNNVGFYAIFLGVISVGLWLTKKSLLKARAISGEIVVVLRQCHILCGWLAFILAVGHSAFYLIMPLGHRSYVSTGIAATAIMFFLVGVGTLYEYRAIKLSVGRKVHLVTTIVLTLSLLVHM